MSIFMIRPGLLSSLQDLGRYGYQKHGVIVSGVMDPLAHRLANILVGNEENAATMEITMMGPVIEFQRDTLFSLCGGDLTPTIEGVKVPMWRPVWVKQGTQLKFGNSATGCRAYLAVAGGFDVPDVMGSKSTYLRGGIGGYRGRALQAGDELPVGAVSELSNRLFKRLSQIHTDQPFQTVTWAVSSELLPFYTDRPTIRVIRGNEYRWFTEKSREQFFQQAFSVSPQSDRMGYRIKGPQLELMEPRELISEAVAFGTVQVPPEGQPIVLLADRQTTGGYPKIAQIISVDLPLMAQVKPGDHVHFYEVSHQEAEELYLSREREIRQLKWGISIQA
ncbi:biotin-dependent carboxyltransferase family protein [Ammoniphilus sp. CFH 90114]|uniref:5-oxoprolinase subunit C family protein n=1 Tax=Ammoniphilus sp. CFH 90114 TaxID=2493665 RepID=UPI00100F9380|nr:biotin-dependent carboxyltransferase family protein [Ammoniphilus sp. CFH 90114]RXT04933.1 biotin-dependent carboxyltransferase family protein [Ammoniphilus sp. CFH 90114]